jgi:quercetin dioxygenase-like cupin family protein
LKRGQGKTYDVGIEIAVKAGEFQTTHGAAAIEFVTRKGEEPGEHVHSTEDEMFYVVQGELTFDCDGDSFEVKTGGFVFLPRGLSHNYTVRSDDSVRLLVITAPPRARSAGWDGFVGGFESGGDG